MSGSSPRSRPVRAFVSSCCFLLLAGALAGCSDDPEPERKVAVVETGIADFDGRTVTVPRASFCSRYADRAVVDAVGEVKATRHHGNGEPVPGVGDLGHEFGCSFVGTDGLTASAWVFVPPVTPTRAKQLIAAARRERGCQALEGHRFGRPALGLICTSKRARVASYRGLFGDTWLTCAVTDRRGARESVDALQERAGDWCVQSASAAAG